MTTAIRVGNIGKLIAGHLTKGGERVVLAARDESNASALANRLGDMASAASVEKAISDADVVVFAVWFDTIKDLIAEHRERLSGKIVVDPSNPITLDSNGGFVRTLPDGQSAASVIAGLLVSAHFDGDRTLFPSRRPGNRTEGGFFTRLR
jgi:predicted dinucleotide-binding enzyme